MTLTITFTTEELPGLRKALNRAMNTWDPHDQPRWLQDLSDLVDKKLAPQAAAPSLQAMILAQINTQQMLDKLRHQGGVR